MSQGQECDKLSRSSQEGPGQQPSSGPSSQGTAAWWTLLAPSCLEGLRKGLALLSYHTSRACFQDLHWSRDLAPTVRPGRDTFRSRPGALCVLWSFGIAPLAAAGVARLAQPAGSIPPPTGNQDMLQCPPPSPAGLTLREAWWVVIDISDHDGDCGGSRQATQLSCHVCGTDHHLVAVLSLAVQVCHGRPDHTWKPAGQLSTGRAQSHRQGEAGRGHWRLLGTRSRPKQDQLDLPLHMRQMLQYSTNLHGPSLDLLWYAHRIIFGVGYSTCISPVHNRRTVASHLLGTLCPTTALLLPEEPIAGHKQYLLNLLARGYMSKSQLKEEKGTGEKNKPGGCQPARNIPKILLKPRNGHRPNLLPASLLMKRERVPTAAFPMGYLQLPLG